VPAGTAGGPIDSGFVLQTRLTTATILSAVGLAPGLMVGFRSGDLTLGAGLGLTFFQGSVTDPDPMFGSEDGVNGYIIEILPTIAYDLWSSNDGNVRLNFVGALGLAFGAVTTYTESVGAPTDEASASVILLPIRLGLGGDYYFHPNFALGAEVGMNLMFLLSTSSEPPSAAEIGGGTEGTYAAMRLTFLIGS